MTPENNIEPTPSKVPEGVVTGVPESLQTSPEPVILTPAPEVITGMPEELKTQEPQVEPLLEAGQAEPLLKAPAAPMLEFGGYTNLQTPSEAEILEKKRQMTEAAGQPVETPQTPEAPQA